MSSSIPVENIRKINSLDEIPYKDVNHHKVYNNYLNQMNYLLSLSGDEIDNQIEKDINYYNNYIDLIISKNNRITNKVRNEYNNLLTKLTADRNFKRYINEENDINEIDSSIFNNEENNFSDSDKMNDELIDRIKNLNPIISIDDLLLFSEPINSDDTFLNNAILNKSTDNFIKDDIDKLIKDFISIDNAILDYNYMIDLIKDDKYFGDINEINEVMEEISKASELYRYYDFNEIQFNQLFPISLFWNENYSSDFNHMLYQNFNKKLIKFIDENKNKKKMYIMIRYFYKNEDMSKETPLQVTNSYYLPEYVLQGLSKEKVVIEVNNKDLTNQYSGGEDTETLEPIANRLLSFEFYNSYDKVNQEKFGNKIVNKRTNKEGQLFPYKINKKVFDEYFGKYTKKIIDILYKYQIFEEFNPLREEYKYNCLLYSIYQWFCKNESKEMAEIMCRQLFKFNANRLTTLKDISNINEYFKNISDKIGKRYKIEIYRWNNIQKKLLNCADHKDKSDMIKIKLCLLESTNFKYLNTNHFMIYEQIDFKDITNEDNNELLKLINGLKDKNSKRNNYGQLSSYLLVRYLLENEDHKFFIEFNTVELNEILNEEDRIKKEIKNKKLVDCIKEIDWSNNNFVKEVKTLNNNLNKPKNISFDNAVSDDPNWNNEYDYLCAYDFETSTLEKDHHEAYMICYFIMKYPKKIYNDEELNDFIKNFNKNYKIETIYGKDCAKQFLDILPDKCLCYAHNAKYDISFLTNEDTSIKGCENSTTIYSRMVDYKDKHFTFKDSYKLISMKLAEFPNMFKLGDTVKEVFPYTFYTFNNLNKYDKKWYNIYKPEFKEIKDDLIKGFGVDRKQKYIKFKKVIRDKFGGQFNMVDYSKFYCERDVELLVKGLICMRTYLYSLTKMDCFKQLTIPGIIHRVMLSKVYTKHQEGKIYMYSGVINQYIQSALYGGVCTSWRNAKLFIKMIISDYDAKSLYPSAIARLYTVSGKCKPFTEEDIKTINNSMHVDGKFDNSKCWLLENTNTEDEADKNKINAYIVTIKILRSRRIRNSPRIIVKNEKENGKLPYPNLDEGSIMVNVDPNKNLNNPRYKKRFVNKAEVTVDNIMLEDYIKYHDIEFEVIGGIYWRNSEYISFYDCFNNMEIIKEKLKNISILSENEYAKIYKEYCKTMSKEEKELFNVLSEKDKQKKCKDLIEKLIEDKKNNLYKELDKYETILSDKSHDEKFEIISDKFDTLMIDYEDIKISLEEIEEKSKFTIRDRRIKEEYIMKMNNIKNQMYELDKDDGENTSVKDFKIRKVIEKFYNARLEYQAQGNNLEKVLKLLLNSVYGKTIEKAVNKKINYVKLYDKKYVKFNSEKDRDKKINLLEDYRYKLEEQYKNNEITSDEYKHKMDDLNSVIVDDNGMECTWSPYQYFLDNNKNKILEEHRVNDNLYRIETIEQIEDHYSLNLIGVQILSMSKRIMNEVICTAEDIGINVYYQDTDSIHVENDKIELLEKEFEKRFGRKLRGNKLGQFHPDFDKCYSKNRDCIRLQCKNKKKYNILKLLCKILGIKMLGNVSKDKTKMYYIYLDKNDNNKLENYLKNLNKIFNKTSDVNYICDKCEGYDKIYNCSMVFKSSVSLSKLLIVCGKKIYLDVLFDPDINKIINENEDDAYVELKNYDDNYHIRLKGIPKEVVYYTVKAMKISMEELYTKLFNGEKVTFYISRYKPSFKYTKEQTVKNYELSRDVQCFGNRYIFEEGLSTMILDTKTKEKKRVVNIKKNLRKLKYSLLEKMSKNKDKINKRIDRINRRLIEIEEEKMKKIEKDKPFVLQELLDYLDIVKD